EMRDVQREERGSFRALKWPEIIFVLVPLREPCHEVRLRGPQNSVVHRPAVFQPLQQHRIKSSGANNLADRKTGKILVEAFWLRRPDVSQQKISVVAETRDQVVGVVSQLDVAAVNQRQIWIGIGDLF